MDKQVAGVQAAGAATTAVGPLQSHRPGGEHHSAAAAADVAGGKILIAVPLLLAVATALVILRVATSLPATTTVTTELERQDSVDIIDNTSRSQELENVNQENTMLQLVQPPSTHSPEHLLLIFPKVVFRRSL